MDRACDGRSRREEKSMLKHRQRRMAKRLSVNSIRPKDNRGGVSCVSLLLLDYAWVLPAAFCLTLATIARVTRQYLLLGQTYKTFQN